jgi:starch synthase (maltosyl-transferring)
MNRVADKRRAAEARSPDSGSAQKESIRSAETGRARAESRGGSAEDGRVRAVVDAVRPSIDAGRFAVKRIAGEPAEIEADCFTDGHDALRVRLAWRAEQETEWREVEMSERGNDLWTASFTPPAPGAYRYTVIAWVDHFRSWRKELARRVEPADINVAGLVGAQLIEEAAARANVSGRARGADASALRDWAARLRALAEDLSADIDALRSLALDELLAQVAERYPDRSRAARHGVELPLFADRARARFSSWYELFPRSAGSGEAGRHGTLRDVEARLGYVAELGFDVLYLPPIHPIGRERRKGRNNALGSEAADVGSPWAIGSSEGGHKAIHPQLGTLEDFRSLAAAARSRRIELALDIALQCAPDHPYVKAHPEWFRHRPDGSVQYAENPPKKYQDIYPFNFEADEWRPLWDELKSVLDFWIGEGVRIFRVDNPHTKPFAFWEWAIGEVRRAYPEVIFLAEAFTRPKVMHRLAKLGFSQSYTYFTWRNSKRELTEYFTELTRGPGRDYFRPNVWPNTPDILPEPLQFGGRPMFMARLVLAATLAANYGIYGPAYELMESAPREPGSEEYLDSEKYQLRHWDLERSDSLRAFVARVNRIRRDNPALHADASLRFLPIDNDQLIAYVKTERSLPADNVVLVIVNLDPHHRQSGWLEFDAGIDTAESEPFQVHDLIGGGRFLWQGARNFVQLDPQRSPAHVFLLRRRLRREQDFDYFL